MNSEWKQPDVLIYISSFGKESSKSHDLLRKAAARYTRRDKCDWNIALGAKGKPYFSTAPRVHFSITHSGGYWMCAFSSREVGLDLQVHRTCSREKLSQRFFHPKEDAFLRLRDYADFFDLWAAKESYVKYTGCGIARGFNDFSTVASDGKFPSVQGARLRLIPWREGYSLCLCARQLEDVSLAWLRE